MQIFLFQGFAALVAVAAWIQGNVTAAWLATLASLLSMLVIKTEKSSLSRPPHEVRGREERRRKAPATYHGERHMTDDRSSEVAERIHQLVGQMTQHAMQEAENSADATRIAGMAALGSLIPMAPFTAKNADLNGRKPEDVPEDERQELMFSTLSPETMIFAALLTGRMLTAFNAKTGYSSTEFGPNILWEALQDWRRVFPDKSADDFIHPKILDSARKFGENPKLPKHITAGREEVISGYRHTTIN